MRTRKKQPWKHCNHVAELIIRNEVLVFVCKQVKVWVVLCRKVNRCFGGVLNRNTKNNYLQNAKDTNR